MLLIARLVGIWLLMTGVTAFQSYQLHWLRHRSRQASAAIPDISDSVQSSTSLVTSLLQKVSPDQARSEFFFFFFGGSGALGIGGAQIPKLLAEFKELQALAGGVTKGGKILSILPLATLGYPESLREADIEDIINSVPSVETILKKGPKTSYLAQKGFLEREGFSASLPGRNPLALYAAYDALSKGGGDLAAPQEAAQVIAAWKSGGVEAFKNSLLLATVRKYSAYSVFALLIALVLDLIIESGINAFL